LAGILLVLLALSATTARGQIASYVDEHGKHVFINGNPPIPRLGNSPAKRAGEGAGWASGRRSAIAQPGHSGNSGRFQRPAKEGLEKMVQETAAKHRVDPALVRAVISAESNWDPFAVSRRGALGLMQLIPGTAVRFGVGDAFNPQQNLEGGVKYLRTLLERYNGDLNLSLAAYNAGEHAVDRARGVPHFAETQNYVQKVIDSYFRPDSGRGSNGWNPPAIRRDTDERGRVIFTNE
jgi:soluble lytic murein transglycosylase-like protein